MRRLRQRELIILLSFQASKMPSWTLISVVLPKSVFDLCKQKESRTAVTLLLILRKLNITF